MNRIMLDLETLGVAPGCTVLSIGAVFFSTSEPEWRGADFYMPINRMSCSEVGLREDPNTLAWWAKQDKDTREKLWRECELAMHVRTVLKSFGLWLHSNAAAPSFEVWGNGNDFDKPILEAAYKACGMQAPWTPYSGRCYRTLKDLRRDVKMERSGTHHNALDDAVSQAEHAVRLFKEIKA